MHSISVDLMLALRNILRQRRRSAIALALAMLTTLAASVYPAWKASRLVIVDALRHNR